jgi:hypothetical protein
MKYDCYQFDLFIVIQILFVLMFNLSRFMAPHHPLARQWSEVNVGTLRWCYNTHCLFIQWWLMVDARNLCRPLVCIESGPFVWTEAVIRPTGHLHLPHGQPLFLSRYLSKLWTIALLTLRRHQIQKQGYSFALQWWIFVRLFSSLSLVWMLSDSSQSTCVDMGWCKI